MSYQPKIGDLLARYVGASAQAAQVLDAWLSTAAADPGAVWVSLSGGAHDDPEAWPAADLAGDGWRLVARGAVPLDERPIRCLPDERSEVERLREDLADAKREIGRLERQARCRHDHRRQSAGSPLVHCVECGAEVEQ